MVKRTINVNLDAYEKFRKISMARPQDATYAETFDHVLDMLEKLKLEQEAKKV